MANSFAKITRYLSRAVDTVFATESKTAVLENGQKYIDLNFTETGYIKILDILMDGLSDYHKVNNGNPQDGYTSVPTKEGFSVGNATTKWNISKLTQLRGKQFQVDFIEDEEQAGMVMANLLMEFLRTRVVPEIDAYRFSKIASSANVALGNIKTETISANSIIAQFNSAFEWLTENEVPSDEQVIFVSPAVMTLIRNTTELNRRLVTEASPKSVDLRITTYEGREIIEVPSSRFFTDILIHQNGFGPNTTSKVINYLICDKKCVVPVMKLEYSKIWGPDQVQEFHGYKVNTLFYHDVIIPKNKLLGVYVSVSNVVASTKSSALRLAITKNGSAENSYFIDGIYTLPAGLHGKVVASATALTLGATVENPTFLPIGNDPRTAVTITGTDSYFALVDATNKVIAVSSQITLPTD